MGAGGECAGMHENLEKHKKTQIGNSTIVSTGRKTHERKEEEIVSGLPTPTQGREQGAPKGPSLRKRSGPLKGKVRVSCKAKDKST